jgi:micrococcal nuclease
MGTKLLSLLFFLLSATTTFTGKVIKITDGDTIVVLTDNKEQVKIRLEGIDCPESKQDFGQKAKQATADLCFGKQVNVVKSGEDRYGRTLGFVYIGDKCINKELLKQGLAWHYKYFNKDEELAKLEQESKEKKIGLWSQPNPVAPWDYRRK